MLAPVAPRIFCDASSNAFHIGVGETTEDGKFTLREVECLASCGTAPVLQINDEFHERVTTRALDALLELRG